jgi:hypothetical protein
VDSSVVDLHEAVRNLSVDGGAPPRGRPTTGAPPPPYVEAVLDDVVEEAEDMDARGNGVPPVWRVAEDDGEVFDRVGSRLAFEPPLRGTSAWAPARSAGDEWWRTPPAVSGAMPFTTANNVVGGGGAIRPQQSARSNWRPRRATLGQRRNVATWQRDEPLYDVGSQPPLVQAEARPPVVLTRGRRMSSGSGASSARSTSTAGSYVTRDGLYVPKRRKLGLCHYIFT